MAVFSSEIPMRLVLPLVVMALLATGCASTGERGEMCDAEMKPGAKCHEMMDRAGQKETVAPTSPAGEADQADHEQHHPEGAAP